MTKEQLLKLLDYIDAAVEASWNTGPYARVRLETKLARLKDELTESVLNNKPKE